MRRDHDAATVGEVRDLKARVAALESALEEVRAHLTEYVEALGRSNAPRSAALMERVASALAKSSN